MTPEHTALVATLEGFQQGYAESVADADGTLALMRKTASAIRELSQEREEARALQRDYRREQILAKNDAAMVRAVWSNLQPKLEADIAHWKQVDSLRCEELAHTQAERDTLRSEVGALKALLKDAAHRLVSLGRRGPCQCQATSGYTHHCEGCRALAAAERIALALADKPRFTDGHGNSLDHLLDEKP